MKVLHINSNYLYTTLHEKLIEGLQGKNIINQIYMPTHGGIDFAIPPKGYVHYPICFNKLDRYLYHFKQKKMLIRLVKDIDINSYNVVHAHTLFTDGYMAYKLYETYKIPYVVAVRNTDVNAFFKKRVFLRPTGLKILEHAEKVIFISEAYKSLVLKKYIPKGLISKIDNKSIVIPNGIDNYWLENKSVFTNEKTQDKNIKLIFAGRIDKNKNVMTTIKACEMLRNKGLNVTLTVVGAIADKKEFKKICKYEFVNYIPKQTKEKLMELYRAHDIFVMPSKTETFGLVYAEAMSQGLPVIYTKGEGFDGQFKEGSIGYSVRYFSPSEIADSIVRIKENYRDISHNCLESCGKFNWSIITNKYHNIYGNIGS
ncbi:glycosyltransferase family 4 protein [Priestia aryabhattai]|uniref:glycosyltransferase family 4 protein n=1 Tax=Priestia TaxID=2800373 RepID=UPI00263A8DF7|nr:glycosyltransferase family 4 protein [Priestia megaterium]MDN4861150.1 glycosyltransferase family 4 protein [Priestia megaterium]